MRIQLLALGMMLASFLGISQIRIFPDTLNTITMKNLYDFKVKAIDGSDFDLSQLKGKKVMIVNTASECGLTPQYEQLQELYDEFGGEDFEIIGFPANNFGAQEPGKDVEIAAFCSKNYGVSFPMMAKVSVLGDDQCELYQWLTQKDLNGLADCEVKWNFHKFLVDKEGNLVQDIQPQTLPTDPEILDWLNK